MMKKRGIKKIMVYIACLSVLGTSAQGISAAAPVDVSQLRGNESYTSNQGSLIPETFETMPLGTVQPEGWLKNQLGLQMNGITSAMESYPEYGPSNAWLGGSGDATEKAPYYVRGLVALAYTLRDDTLMQKAQKWVDWSINSQTSSGYFGPASDPDWWTRMPMLMAIRDYYEATERLGRPDGRVIPFMEKYFRYEAANLPSNPLSSWGQARGGDNLETVYWLYNREYNPNDSAATQWLLDLANLIQSQTTDWSSILTNTTVREHVVNTSEGLKDPILYYMQSGLDADKNAFAQGLFNIGIDHGRIDGLPNADEGPEDNKPSRGTELCGIVESMLSTELGIHVLGDASMGDRLELQAYNSLPAAYAPDYLGQSYYVAQNQVLATAGYREFNTEHGDDTSFDSPAGFECCFPNNHMGWPKFVQSMWMATPDNGLAAVAYGPNKVTAKVAGGKTAVFTQETNYPFDETITLNYSGDSAQFPLELRMPQWCSGPSVTVNGVPQTGIVSDSFYKINRTWSSGDKVVITFPMTVSTSDEYNDAVSVQRGPLLYSLRIKEDWRNVNDNDTRDLKVSAQGGLLNREVHPASAWNYGLVVDESDPGSSFTVKQSSALPNQPFSEENAPVVLKAKGQLLPGWKVDGNNVATYSYGSTPYDASKAQDIELIPFGCARLRITQFPKIGTPSVTFSSSNVIVSATPDGAKTQQFKHVMVPEANEYNMTVHYTGRDLPAWTAQTVRLEAENGTRLGASPIVETDTQASGKAFVGNIDNVGDGISFPVNITNSGTYRIKAAYMTAMPTAQHEVFVDGVSADKLSYPINTGWSGVGTGGWQTAEINVSLSAGSHTVTLKKTSVSDSFAQLDYIEIGPADANQTTNTLDFVLNGRKISTLHFDSSGTMTVSGLKAAIYDSNFQFTAAHYNDVQFVGDNNITISGIDVVPVSPVDHIVVNSVTAGKGSFTVNSNLTREIAPYSIKYGTSPGHYTTTASGFKGSSATITGLASGKYYLKVYAPLNGADQMSDEQCIQVAADSSVGTTVAPDPPFTEDFTDASGFASNWTMLGNTSKIAVSDGRLTFGADPDEKAYLNGGVSWNNYVAQADITLNGSSGNNAGMMFRATNLSAGPDSYHGYYFGIYSGGAVIGYADGSWHQLKNISWSISDGTKYQLKVMAYGSRMVFYIDNQLVASINDSRYTVGTVGFRTYQAPFSADNILVRAMTDDEIRQVADAFENRLDISGVRDYGIIQLRYPTSAGDNTYKIEWGTQPGIYTNEVYEIQANRNHPYEKTAFSVPDNHTNYYVRVVGLMGSSEDAVSAEIIVPGIQNASFTTTLGDSNILNATVQNAVSGNTYQMWVYQKLPADVTGQATDQYIWVPMTAGANNSFSLSGATADANGNYRVSMIETDSSGNVLTKSFDTPASKPTNALRIQKILVGGKVTNGRETVNLDDSAQASKNIQIVADNTTGYTLTYGTADNQTSVQAGSSKDTFPVSFANLGIGTYTFTATATNDAGQKDVRTFTVTTYSTAGSVHTTPVISGMTGGFTGSTLGLTLAGADTQGNALKDGDGFLYRFRASEPGRGISYSASSVSGPTGSVPVPVGKYGTYQVYATAAYSTSIAYDDAAMGYYDYTRPGGAVTVSSYTVKENGGADSSATDQTGTTGKTYSFNATADGSKLTGGETARYSFWRCDASGWVLLKDWSPDATLSWTPAYAGKYIIQVRVQGSKAGSYESARNMTFDVSSATGLVTAKNVSLTLTATGNKARQPVTLTTAATPSAGLLYRYQVQDPTLGLTLLNAYSPDNTFTWVPRKAGSYTVYVQVINQNSFGMYDKQVSQTVTVS